MPRATLTTDDLVFVAFNGRVLAIDREDGSIVWKWRPQAKGAFASTVMLLPSDDRLIVSINGYTWALDLVDGRELWFQPFKGEGTGIPVLASTRSVSDGGAVAGAAAAQAAAAAAAAGAAVAASSAAAAG
ncbi:MAG: hypothetical protein RL136_914 [Planctomycetota bacterium]|jgi:outer membrane protein assembly factor BamB